MSVNEQSLSINQPSNCMDLVPYVPREQALELAAGKKKSPLSKLSVPVLNLVTSFLPIGDLPAFAGTSAGNQQLAVHSCFRRMKETLNAKEFEEELPRAISLSRGKRNIFRAKELLKIDGACQVLTVDNASRFLAGREHNLQVAQKLCNVTSLQFCLFCPDLSPFATHCAQLTNLWLENVQITGEEVTCDFLKVRTLTVWGCPQMTENGLSNLLFHCPSIQTVDVIDCASISEEYADVLYEASDDHELNKIFHG